MSCWGEERDEGVDAGDVGSTREVRIRITNLI